MITSLQDIWEQNKQEVLDAVRRNADDLCDMCRRRDTKNLLNCMSAVIAMYALKGYQDTTWLVYYYHVGDRSATYVIRPNYLVPVTCLYFILSKGFYLEMQDIYLEVDCDIDPVVTLYDCIEKIYALLNPLNIYDGKDMV